MKKQTNAFQISICKILFPYTVELARNGNYKEAEASLRFMLDNDISPEYFLLLGKIYAQQGKYQDAIGEWKKVLEIDTENREARAAILKAEEMSENIRPAQLSKWRLGVGVICILLVLSVGMSISLWWQKASIGREYESILIEHKNLATSYEKLEQETGEQYEKLKRETDKQIVIGIEEKIKNYLEKIMSINDIDFAIKHKGAHIWVSGDVPTLHVKDLVGNLVRKSKGVESVDITGIEISHKYTISPGDELGKIAYILYGNKKGWEEIFNANGDKINNPDRIQPGVTLFIP